MLDPKRRLRLFSIIVILSTLHSCGSGSIGYGVVYMDDDKNKLEAGSVLPVTEESEIRDEYTLETADSSKAAVSRWKVNFFEKESDAQAFASEYAEYKDIYAETMKNGLSIRQEPDIQSERVYKLREQQLLKIISREPSPETIAGSEGYWYTVLTEDGTTGYCFDLNLRLFNIKTQSTEDSDSVKDPMLDIFLSKVYRPDFFLDMIRKNTIDLSRFRTTTGIFSFPEEKRIELVTEDFSTEFNYSRITRNNSGRFIFEGTSLQIEVRSEDRIAAYYTHNNREYAEAMIYIDNIEERIDSEIERRELLYQALADLGTVSSSAYGRITFEEDEAFTWTDFGRLVPNAIPDKSGNTGIILLNYFPGSAIASDYDGVISFSFDGIPAGGLVNFLFELSDLGIKLVYVPPADIDRNIVERESSSPLVIFMSGAGE